VLFTGLDRAGRRGRRGRRRMSFYDFPSQAHTYTTSSLVLATAHYYYFLFYIHNTYINTVKMGSLYREKMLPVWYHKVYHARPQPTTKKLLLGSVLAVFVAWQLFLAKQLSQKAPFFQIWYKYDLMSSSDWPGRKEYSQAYITSKHVEVSDSSENILPPGCGYAINELDYSETYDTCIIGAGLSGTVFAERTANLLGRKVLVIDSRPHIGGNCYDFIDPKTGILRNQYGSHLFHTKIKRVWDYVNSNPKAPRWKPWHVIIILGTCILSPSQRFCSPCDVI
jgi:hypothetical protein